MHPFVSFNRDLVRSDDAKLSGVSAAALYGRGVFTTVAIIDGEPFLWNKHLKRLEHDAERLGLSIPQTREGLSESLYSLVSANRVSRGRARVTVFESSAPSTWYKGTQSEPHVQIQTGDPRRVRAKPDLTISSYPVNSRSPLAGIKSCNYLEHLIAFEDARSNGFDEAVRLNELGEVVSACMANLFWLEAGTGSLCTPALETGCLPGTTREFIIDSFDVVEARMSIEAVRESAKEVFLSSAGSGLVRASGIVDPRKLGQTGVEPVIAGLRELFRPFYGDASFWASR